MNGRRIMRWITPLVTGWLLCSVAPAQPTNCEEGNGPLKHLQPQAMTPREIIQKFAAREDVFRNARNGYSYTQEINIQTMEGDVANGEFRQVWEVSYDDKGKRFEKVIFAPQDTLRGISLNKEDFDDIRNRLPFALTTDDLPHYDILYMGQQKVDELDAYVFDIAPRKLEKDQRYFQGRIWVENQDLEIVKTCGKIVAALKPAPKKKKKKRNSELDENLSPTFVTYREQIDGKYWFPTYTKADETLHFSNQDVHIREVIKYKDYKRLAAGSQQAGNRSQKQE